MLKKKERNLTYFFKKKHVLLVLRWFMTMKHHINFGHAIKGFPCSM